MNQIVYNGIILVDPNWIDNKIYQLENADNIISAIGTNNIRPRGSGVITNDVLEKVTNDILCRFRLDTEYSEGKTVRFTDGDFALDFKMENDPNMLTRRVYVGIPTNGVVNPLIETIDKLIQLDKGNTNSTNTYSTCFTRLSGITTENGSSSALTYTRYIRYAIDYIKDFIKRSGLIGVRNGQYVMSYSLYCFLMGSAVSIAGIAVRPVITFDNTGKLIITAALDFNERVTVGFKGDLDYRENTKYTLNATPNITTNIK